jgi:hypothetical protein
VRCYSLPTDAKIFSLLHQHQQLFRGELNEVPTHIPPPYFPQDTLSPGDDKTYKKMKLAFFGCLFLCLLALVGIVWGVIYLFRNA